MQTKSLVCGNYINITDIQIYLQGRLTWSTEDCSFILETISETPWFKKNKKQKIKEGEKDKTLN